MHTTRRTFIYQSAAAVGLLASHQSILNANNKVNIAILGLGNKGPQHLNVFNKLPNVHVAAICDPDVSRMDKIAAKLDYKVTKHKDLRKVLEDASIDAVVVAAPNHWHALATIWALQAGKHVYVEKPVSHTLHEGRLMIQAAKKYNRIVQSGTQRRSDESLGEAFTALRNGELGKIQHARIIHYGRRDSIGKTLTALSFPKTVDRELWTGPAKDLPIHRKTLHYDWHWNWNTGDGELGNNGPHYTDLARWATGIEKLPKAVLSLGGRFKWNDAGQTPNTHVIYYDTQPVPLIAEIRNLPMNPNTRTSDHYRGLRSGVVIQCEGGYFSGLNGGAFMDNNGKRIRQIKGDGGAHHQANFIKAIRENKASLLNANIETGHASAALCHVGNISHRLGNHPDLPKIKDHLNSTPLLNEAFQRLLTHLENNEIDLNQEKLTMGAPLEINPETEKFNDLFRKPANRMRHGNYRGEFKLTENI